jgi:hypothetical protein
MNALSIFLGEFWPKVIYVTIGISAVSLLRHSRRSPPPTYPLFAGPKSFTELSGFAEDQQRRLLNEASKEAFAGWRPFPPVIALCVIMTAGWALGQTLPKVTPVPDSFWVRACSLALFGGLGCWLAVWVAGRLGVHRVRPFLKALIERTQHAA